MDRQTFLDAQRWLRRVHEDEFPWPLDTAQRPREGVRQLLPPASERSAGLSSGSHASPSAPVVSCSGCFHQASRICYFRVADADEDQTVLQVQVIAVERHRGGVSMLLVRFDREAVFEIALSAVQSVVLPVEPKPDTANKLPPFGELNFGSVNLRLWLEPYDMPSQDARRAMSNALRGIEMLRSKLMLRLREKEVPSTPMHLAFRHNPWIQHAGDETSSPSLLTASDLLARGSTVLKSSADKDILKNVVDAFADRKRKRDAHAMARRRRDKVEKSSEDDVSEERIEPAQRDPESEGSDPLTTAESFELLAALTRAFSDNHTALQRLLRIRDDIECSEHEACSALSQAEGSMCVLKKWRKWDDFLQLAKHAFCANNKRQRLSKTTDASSEPNEAIVEAGKVLAGAFLEPTDVVALEAAHGAAINRLRELESMMFSSLFPKPTDLAPHGERPPRTPVKLPRRSQNAITPSPARHPQEQSAVPPTATEHVLNLLVESRRALVRRELATRCLPRRAHELLQDMATHHSPK